VQRPYILIAILFPVYAAGILIYESLHPERGRWRDLSATGQGLFSLCYTVAAVLIVVNLALLVPVLRRRVRLRRIGRMLGEAKALQAAGRHAEADRILAAIERLWGRHGLNRWSPLRNGGK
jgi:hypothetical protein